MAKAVHVPRQRSGELILLSRGNTGAGSVLCEYRKPWELGGRVLIAFRLAQSRARIKTSLIDRPAQAIGGAGT